MHSALCGKEESNPRSRSALVVSSRSVMAAAPPIAGPATRPVDLSSILGVSGRPLMAPDVRGHDMALAQSYNGLRWGFGRSRDGLDPLGPSLCNDLPDIIVVSAGAKHHFQNYRSPDVDDAQKWRRILPEVLTRERSIKVVDLRQLRDESKGALGSHTGRHPEIISQLLASKAGRFYLNDEYKFIRECVERGERILLLAFCISNRHRSVAFATCVGAAFWPMPAMVIHLDTYVGNNWETMRCGGRCDQCGEKFQSAASATALHNQVISHLSPAALGPIKAQQVRQRSMPPHPAAHNFPRSSAPGPAAPIYHRLRAASVSGAGSSSDRRRPAEPPSTPRATRATPPAPSASSARETHDFTLDDPDHGVEYWKIRAIRAEAQTDMCKDELRMVRAEADASSSSVVEMSPTALARGVHPERLPGTRH